MKGIVVASQPLDEVLLEIPVTDEQPPEADQAP